MTKQYNFDDYEVVSEATDGTLLLKPKPKKAFAKDWSWCWAVMPPHGTEFREGWAHFTNSVDNAEARARRLAAELNGEIESAEQVIRGLLADSCPNGGPQCDRPAHFHAWAYLKAGEA